jgi:uncharacterized protein (TIGR00730 family)
VFSGFVLAGFHALPIGWRKVFRHISNSLMFSRAGCSTRQNKRPLSPTRKNIPPRRHSSPAYRLAFRDTDFLLREELRPVRFQLELLKPEMLLEEAGIGSTLVVYGSARIPSPEHCRSRPLALATTPERMKVAERLVAKSNITRKRASWATSPATCAIVEKGMRQFVVCSGGGPSIMEAANRGAVEAGAERSGSTSSCRTNRRPTNMSRRILSFQFHYFALRKMHFLLRARAVAVFPGGFGTLDEFLELLTLIQTGKMKPIPILLFGKEYWSRVINFEAWPRKA